MSSAIRKDQSAMSQYRWVMAAIAGLLMTTSFISLTSFGILSGRMASTFGVSPTVLSVLGIDAFSIGLFAAFFLGQGGIFDARLKTGVLVAQLFLIVPQFLIPIFHVLYVLVALRFFQGLMIMMLALFSIQLEGWFPPDERARSLAFTLGAISLGSAAGGILSGVLISLSWQESYYITGIIMVAGALIYFIFAKDSTAQRKEIIEAEKLKHRSVWKDPMVILMGLAQLPLSWVLFSVGGYLSTYSYHLGYSVSQTGTLIIGWGISGFIAAFVGAVLGDRIAGKRSSNRGILKSRLVIMTTADILMALGIVLMMTTGRLSFYYLLLAAVVNGFLMMFPPNYWALPGNIFPLAIVSAGAFGMGLISNSADAIGPLVTSSLLSDLGWNGIFFIMLGLSFLGILINLIIYRSKIPLPGNDSR
ncbi:MAG: MFS transporter [Candidatus Thermoplasmatota archaeon]|nr:MFS transporter [Candidatus Thermoplasmatota archaeon]MCL5732137.1 MFS transporter [Candidatus Thermoplasmatota archaeon]